MTRMGKTLGSGMGILSMVSGGHGQDAHGTFFMTSGTPSSVEAGDR